MPYFLTQNFTNILHTNVSFLLADGHFEVEPQHRLGAAKYCGHRPENIGLYTTESFGALADINPQLTEILTKDANNRAVNYTIPSGAGELICCWMPAVARHTYAKRSRGGLTSQHLIKDN